MTKSKWEGRVGKLFVLPDFVYKYKPVDGPHGGAVKLDWLASDKMGTFWQVEVKWLSETRKSFNLNAESEMRALQKAAMDDIAMADYSVPLLAIGQGDFLYWWGWRYVRWLERERKDFEVSKPHHLPLETATVIMHWTGEKHWPPQNVSLIDLFSKTGIPRDRLSRSRMEQAQERLSKRSGPTDVSLSTWKHAVSIRTPAKTRRSER